MPPLESEGLQGHVRGGSRDTKLGAEQQNFFNNVRCSSRPLNFCFFFLKAGCDMLTAHWGSLACMVRRGT